MADQKHQYSLSFKSLLIAAFLLWIPDVGFSAAAIGSPGRGQGQWQLLLNNTGVVAMHMALTHQNTVLMFDQTGSGPTGYRLRHRYNGRRCTRSKNDFQDSSCYAHTVEYDIFQNKISPLTLYTDPWGSSGSFLSNGTLLQTGGFGHGSRSIRYFRPCQDRKCDWKESRRRLSNERWYASNQRLPGHDRVIVLGGTRVFTYEFVPKRSDGEGAFDLPFLHQTYDPDSTGGNNLYPFLHLSSDGNLFIFANRDSILFNLRRNRVVKTFPQIPGAGSRNYPSSGSSVILPLDHRDGFQKVEVMVCGGAASGAYKAAGEGRYLKGLSSCGRMVITGNKHKWNMENMPGPRLLNDMLILPTGDILIINGAQSGCGGSNNARNASLQPYLYKPNSRLGRRFSVLKSTKIARMYHSTAIVLPDGRILVAGSNPNNRYASRNVAYPTELRLQAFVPQYMGREYHNNRPINVTIHYGDHGEDGVKYGREFRVGFSLGTKPSNGVEFNVYAPPVTTHSISMNQRMLKLKCRSMERAKDGRMDAIVQAPPSSNVAPPGYFMLTVVNGGIPSISQWVRFTDT
ncbi:aldehyde oxidase GLOX-like [Juglans regia]|uniref:Aldehyde oxidase GLOX-like n=2 Tax=Juglans regia TaxID=51240 RepID=A0A2I4FNT5_JUGRE|nr:aldehyde oxidase GLOX-like [Juglans regia]